MSFFERAEVAQGALRGSRPPLLKRSWCGMATWANPTVARLAEGTVTAGECCGLVINCSWPMPAEVLQQYEHFGSELARVMPQEAYVYPASTLHCTVCTLRSFTVGPMGSEERSASKALWLPVLAAARSSQGWPKAPFRLRMSQPTLEGSAGIIRYEDTDGAMARMRACLREAIIEAGGRASEGFDRSRAQALTGAKEGEVAPHLPDIVHSTVLRWKDEPPDAAAAKDAFDRIASTWIPVDISVPRLRAVWEDVPYMHIPADDAHIWWESEPWP